MCCKENCCLQRVSSFVLRCLHYVKGFLILIPFLFHEALLWLMSVSLAVGLTAAFGLSHQLCWNRPLPIDVQAVLALILMSCFGEGASLMLRDTYVRTYFQKWKQEYPFIFRTIPSMLWWLGFLSALFHLYIGFKDAHPSANFPNQEKDDGGGGVDPRHLNAKSSLLVLCSLSFITYTLPRKSDWVKYRLCLTPNHRRRQLGIILFFALLGAEAALLIFYSIPVVTFAIVCNYKGIAPHVIFPVTILIGLGMGLNIALVEDRYIFEMRPMTSPLYAYENHLASRVNFFQFVLIPLVAVSYYGSGPFGYFNTEDQFVAYTIFIGMSLLQIAKSTCNRYYLHELERLRETRLLQEIQEFLLDLEEQGHIAPEDDRHQAEEEQGDLPVPGPSVTLPQECPEKDEDERQNGNQVSSEILNEILETIPLVVYIDDEKPGCSKPPNLSLDNGNQV